MEIPFIFLSFLYIAVAKTSAHTMNINYTLFGESGHPCLTPQLKTEKNRKTIHY